MVDDGKVFAKRVLGAVEDVLAASDVCSENQVLQHLRLEPGERERVCLTMDWLERQGYLTGKANRGDNTVVDFVASDVTATGRHWLASR